MPKAAKISLIVVAVLAVLLVATDRALAFFAEGAIKDQVTQKLADQGIESSKPDVSIHGFPFLTQVIGGEYDEVTIDSANVRTDQLSLNDLTVRAAGVKADTLKLARGEGTVTADRMTGSGVLPYSSIATLLRQPDLTIVADNGRLKIRTPIRFAGQSIMVAATGEIALDEGRLRLTVTDVRPDGGGLPTGAQALLSALGGKLTQEIDIPPLPYGLVIEKLEVAGDGLRIQASATNVPLVR